MVVATQERVEPRSFAPVEPSNSNLLPQYTMVRAGDINLDETYQRSLRPGWLKRLEKTFNLAYMTPLSVNERPDGSKWATDGGHRLSVVLKLFGADFAVPCMMTRGLTREQEAKKFDLSNNALSIQLLDRMRTRLQYGENEALAISNILAKYGLRFAASRDDKGTGSIRAVESLVKCYRRDVSTFIEVIDILHEIWGVDPSAYQRMLVLGLFDFLQRYGNEYKRSVLLTKLKALDPTSVTTKARMMVEFGGVSGQGGSGRAGAEAIKAIYNYKLQTRRIG